MANNTNESPQWRNLTKPNQTKPVGWTNFVSFTWCIEDFTNKMKMEVGERLESRLFSFHTHTHTHTSWYLSLFPNGEGEESKGDVSLYLVMNGKYKFPVHAEITFSIVDKGGKKAHLMKFENTFEKNRQNDGMGYVSFVSHSELLKFQDSSLCLLPDNALTILCEISMAGGSGTGEPYKGALERDVAATTASMTRLSSDILSTMADKFADFEIICDGQKLPCHKSVLASRSPVFSAMFSHDMEENRKSSLDILDLDYEIVRDMVVYIYSGHVDGLEDKATSLLAAAEKYDLKELKQMCEVKLSEDIDTDNALDMVVLADLYGASMVRDIALRFIVCNGEEIVTQLDWRDKLNGHPEIIKDMFEIAMKNK